MVAVMSRMRQVCGWTAGLLLLTCAAALGQETPPAPPASAPAPGGLTAETLTDAQVVGAIRRGLDFLIAGLDKKLKSIEAKPPAQRADQAMTGDVGELMLEAYTLLHVGPDMKDKRLGVHSPRMEVLTDVLTRLDTDATYTTALQTLALAQMPATAEIKKAINRTTARLVEGRGKSGGYTYALGEKADVFDGSNSQYALLGVWAAADWGVAVPGNYWDSTDRFWRAIQAPSGGWPYGGGNMAQMEGQPARPSMTAAGLASLLVCDEFINRTPQLVPREDPALDKGMASMLADFDSKSGDLYYLYGVERVGLASGIKLLGGHDWYREMAVNLLGRQKEAGDFGGIFTGANNERATCYAVLLLARGRAPVLMNKLQYEGPWNARPRDSANVHADLARKLERHLNWQIVPLAASPQQWLDAPILLITGSKDPKFEPEDLAKLRQFTSAGGVIFSVADGASREFSDAIKGYALRTFGADGVAAPESAFRQLPPEHALFTVAGKIAKPPTLMGISNGLRELWIHCPMDYGAIWQSRDTTKTEAWDLPLALFSYAAGAEELRSKLQPLTVPAPEKPATRRATVARLAFSGNWNPEPGAWPRLAQLMALDANTALTITEVRTAELAARPALPALGHLAGTGKLVLTPAEQASLKQYVLRGGTLLVEALGGNKEFAATSKEILKSLFPGVDLKLVPPDYTLFSGSFSRDAAKIADVKYRRCWILEHGQLSVPRLEYMTIDHRIGVIFSGEDLTSGLLGTNTWGIGGYMPDSAIALARNIILYAERNAPKDQAPRPAAVQGAASQPAGRPAAGS